jgi:hypothetical protein
VRRCPLLVALLFGVLLMPAPSGAVARTLSVGLVDTSARQVHRDGTFAVRISGNPGGHVTAAAKSRTGGHTVELAKARDVQIGQGGRRLVHLKLVAAGRRRMRAALARCRPARLVAVARGKQSRATSQATLRGGSGCHVSRPAPPAGKPAHFMVGAASVSFAPPAHGALANDPADCLAPGYDGPRPWAFMEPYKDTTHVDPPDPVNPGPPETIPKNGHYDYGEDYVDCNNNGRWDGNFIGGGGGGTRYYTKVADPPSARAVVVSNGSRTIAVEVTDQEGLFNVYQERIRAKVIADLGGAKSPLKDGDMFLSATHDESAPQTLGLNGPRDTVSATDDYFLDYFVDRSAKAIEQAYAKRRAATIRYSQAYEPANFRQCWSSYPYVDDPAVPVMQAVGVDGKTIATLADVSQHTETLGFNSDPVERLWLTADWPHFFIDSLQKRYGGVAIEMAGSVGSVESPEVFPNPISAVPQHYVDESHPAGCRTLFTTTQTHVALGYGGETRAYGEQLATAVSRTIDSASSPSISSTLTGARADICVPITNKLFAAAGAAGVFAHRPSYANGCTTQIGPAPNGSTTGQEAKSQVAVFRIGDGSFVSVPGEVFPFTYLRSFLGPRDMPYPNEALPPWLLPHMHTPFRFVDGLGEDMIGYIFPSGNGVAVPGERDPSNVDPSADDRFGCHHSDDSESASSQAGNIVGDALVKLLDRGGAKPEPIVRGRYVMPDGSLSRDPLGGPTVKCKQDQTYHPKGPAAAVELAGGAVAHPAAWVDLHGRAQPRPTRTTRGYLTRGGSRVWVDGFQDVTLP